VKKVENIVLGAEFCTSDSLYDARRIGNHNGIAIYIAFHVTGTAKL